MTRAESADVAIVGCGPVGALLANLLGQAGLAIDVRRGIDGPGPHGWAGNWYLHQPILERVLHDGLARFLTLMGTAAYNSDSYISLPNTQSIPVWTRFDLGATARRSTRRPWSFAPPSRTSSTTTIGPA